jgi:predicted metalloprotease
MLWKGRRESTNVDDRRKISGGQVAGGGGLLLLIIFAANFFFGGEGGDVGQLLEQVTQTQTRELTPEQQAREDERASFVKVVLADTEDVWDKIFADFNATYTKPTLVLFSGSTNTACGTGTAATGPFYCPGDQDIYIDLSFADELKNRFGAKGDFAMAYVVAHEVGHHVQTLLGTSSKVRQLQSRMNEVDANKLSVMLELQADFYAGLWAHYNQRMNNVIVESDIAEALEAAHAIGDDNLQRQATGTVQPDAFTHGTSEQRMYWFKKGYTSGDFYQGDTFNGLLR